MGTFGNAATSNSVLGKVKICRRHSPDESSYAAYCSTLRAWGSFETNWFLIAHGMKLVPMTDTPRVKRTQIFRTSGGLKRGQLSDDAPSSLNVPLVGRVPIHASDS